MHRRLRLFVVWVLCVLSICAGPPLRAADITFSTLIPQDTDTDRQLVKRQAGALARIAEANTIASTALEASHVLKASAGRLVSLHVYNTGASAQYILLMNSATVPANGAVVLLYPPIKIPSDSNVSLTFPVPLTASTGIAVCNSSTASFTKTIGSADCIFVAQVQ